MLALNFDMIIEVLEGLLFDEDISTTRVCCGILYGIYFSLVSKFRSYKLSFSLQFNRHNVKNIRIYRHGSSFLKIVE